MTAQEVQLAPEVECKRCGYKWRPRQKDIKRCARCKSPYFDTPRRDNSKIYARPDGGHYHTRRGCTMLQGGDFKRLGYMEITPDDIKKRKLRPCACAKGTSILVGTYPVADRQNSNRKEEQK